MQAFGNNQLGWSYMVVCIILHDILVIYDFLLNFDNNGAHHQKESSFLHIMKFYQKILTHIL